MVTHWIVRIGNATNFKASMDKKVWGIIGSHSSSKHFMKHAEEGDVLWFLTNYKVGKKFIGLATFKSHRMREIGPLISLTPTNEELGWDDKNADVEIHYDDLFWIEDLNMTGTYSFQFNVIKTTSVKSDYDFATEYANITKYYKVKKL